jgi:hypothetical protein
MADDAPKRSRRMPIWESLAVFVAIFSLWPAYILRWPHPAWRWLSYVMLALMVVVFVRRTVAFQRLAREAEDKKRKEAEKGQQGRARLPWEPPEK